MSQQMLTDNKAYQPAKQILTKENSRCGFRGSW